MRTKLVPIVPIGLIALALSACSEGGSESSSEDIPEPRTITNIDELSLPLDAYSATLDEVVTYQRAVDIIQRDCLASFGIEVPPQPDEFYAQQRERLSFFRSLVGLTDRDEAEQFGYGTEQAEEEEEGGVRSTFAQLSPSEEDVLDGNVDAYNGQTVPEGGCAMEATRQLSPDRVDSWVPVTQSVYVGEEDMRMQAHFAAQADPAFSDLNADWSECMAESGYDYADPTRIPLQRSAGEALGGEERQLALADVACKEQVNYLGRWEAVHIKYEQEAIDANVSELKETQERLEAQLELAASVVGGE
ncbi:hypothetical protein EF847_07550 [Actinobacteria bacterium YIM 96077]|uniref:Lipoprotein n=1 Tax=Phytoactinopolyspora halophila TaxID=1981511 RepID=A0A329QJG4_9ACTN|nr:hypothetical protein [Phytoactinopolyspora halophila]AYY12582.1 hypothetical protein EF847_07550 [Actinobacteria bacterium YIM 96077]RAW12515.1 hypothetical protein DPM12_14040 [Phytoactinopolyspora halophila]